MTPDPEQVIADALRRHELEELDPDCDPNLLDPSQYECCADVIASALRAAGLLVAPGEIPVPIDAQVIARTRIVADHWREAMLSYDSLRIGAHPLCMVLAALDGETDPAQLGIAPGSDADTALARLDSAPSD